MSCSTAWYLRLTAAAEASGAGAPPAVLFHTRSSSPKPPPPEGHQGSRNRGGMVPFPWFMAGLAVTNFEFIDRKSTRLNSSHLVISYAVFCLKKKKHNDVIKKSIINHTNNKCNDAQVRK